MNSYQISDLERLTGIKAHTIRVWERRYKLIKPHRTTTNIRYYDDEQARKLLKVSTLLAQGLRISKIAGLSDKQLNAHVQELQKEATEDVISLGFVNDLVAAMLAFDEVAFEKTFTAAVIRFGMYPAMLKVIYPFLSKTGMMWSMEEALPIQEHFASAIIRRKLIAAIDGLPAVSRKSKVFLLFLPSGEWHEIGLLLSDYIIRSGGYKTIYLGQNVPTQNLLEIMKTIRPSHLMTLYVTRREPEDIVKELSRLLKTLPKVHLLVAASYPLADVLRKLKQVHLLHQPPDLLELL